MPVRKIIPALCCLLAFILISGCSWGKAGNAARGRGVPPRSIPSNSMFESINPFEMEMTINAHKTGENLRLMAESGSGSEQKADPAFTAAAVSGLPDTVRIEAELLKLINAERVKQKVSALESGDAILWAARIRALELLDSFSHTRPDGSAYYTVFNEVSFSYAGKWHGENASMVSFEKGLYDEERIASMMYENLAASKGNYSNMLREQYGVAGVGVSVRISPDGKVQVSSSQLYAGK